MMNDESMFYWLDSPWQETATRTESIFPGMLELQLKVEDSGELESFEPISMDRLPRLTAHVYDLSTW